MTTVQFPDEIVQMVETRASALGCDVDTFIRQAVLERLEDLEDIEVADERLAIGETPIPIKELKARLGLTAGTS